jgi:uncharacterized protein
MRTHSQLVIDVLELLESPGSRKTLAFSSDVPGLDAGLSHVSPELDFDLVAEAIDGGIWVKGGVAGRYHAECRRCLAPVDRPFSFEAAELYRPSTEVWEEGYVIRDTTIDLEPLVRDTVLLNLPSDPLCRDDCAGLCPKCGANLNDEPHTHEAEVDSRWSALKDLRAAD